ncbi:MAG: cystathionine gamma-synthase [Planctomycetota bacterium]
MNGRIGPALPTRAVRAGLESDGQHGAVTPALHLSSNFTFRGLGDPRTYDYTRSGNPTRSLLTKALVELEGGAGGVVTSTGMSAITVALHTVPAGSKVIAPHDGYGGTFRLLRALHARGALEVEFVDLTDLAVAESAIDDRVALVWIETPSNPLLRITDLAAVTDLAHRHGSLVAADNTFLSPARQRPFDFGSDLVVHSTTKYLNGHSDVVGGAAIAHTPELAESLAWWANCLGVTGAPFDAFLTLRGLRTLDVRWRAHEENAEQVVETLVAHPAVKEVHYPGLPNHTGHDLAKRQQRGFGGMVSFELTGGRAAVERFTSTLQYFSLAESLGGVESLVSHPATMTHAAMTAEARTAAGIGEGLVRLSVGIEAAEDLVLDLRRGLDATREEVTHKVGRPVR